MDPVIQAELMRIAWAAGELHRAGWAPDASGNISMASDLALEGSRPVRSEFTVPAGMDDVLALGPLWISRSGGSMEDLSRDPLGNSGLYLVRPPSVLLIEGLGPPTSELSTHLLVHSSTGCRAIVHCHWGDVPEGLLSCGGEGLPGWIAAAPVLSPGSLELARATVRAMEGSSVVIWPRHGVIAAGKDLRECLSLLERAYVLLNGN